MRVFLISYLRRLDSFRDGIFFAALLQGCVSWWQRPIRYIGFWHISLGLNRSSRTVVVRFVQHLRIVTHVGPIDNKAFAESLPLRIRVKKLKKLFRGKYFLFIEFELISLAEITSITKCT